MQLNPVLPYRNAMEPLVAEEVQQQLRQLPPKLIKYINPAQVIAYALNRLPVLYATSERGWQMQQQKGKDKFASQIAVAVRQGLAAVQRDPLRSATLLVFDEEIASSQSPLTSLELEGLFPPESSSLN